MAAEQDDELAFNANKKRVIKIYGNTGSIYLLEFTDKLMEFIGKFTTYSKRTVCMGAILSEIAAESLFKNEQS